MLGAFFGGATAFPRGEGVWRDDAQGGKLFFDNAVVIQCYTSEHVIDKQMPTDESLGRAKGDNGPRRERSGLTKRLLAEGKWGRLAKVPSGVNVTSETRSVDSRSRAKRRRQT